MTNIINKFLRILPDQLFIQLKYFYHFHRFANLKNPQTFNEKLNWLKLHDRNPLYTTLVDKYAVKQYVAERIGAEHVIPTLGVWERTEDIDFEKLPEKFVLKCTHDSHSVFICRDKKQFDIKNVLKKLSAKLKSNGYWYGREWPYKNVPAQIIAEPYLEDFETHELTDYKFFCFNGKVDRVMVCVERYTGNPKFYFFDRNWELVRINKCSMDAPADFTLKKPKDLDKMFDIATQLSANIPFVRLDLYYCNEKILFGEFTFYPGSGFDDKVLPETDKRRGSLIDLTKIH